MILLLIQLTLLWTASGDDGMLYRASRYDFRYSAYPMPDSQSFFNAEVIPFPPEPLEPGALHSWTVTLPSGSWRIRMAAYDDAGNYSFSNEIGVYVYGPDLKAPTQVTDFGRRQWY